MVNLKLLTVIAVVVWCSAFSGGQVVNLDPQEESTEAEAEAEAEVPTPRTGTPRSATFIPRRRFFSFGKQSKAPAENVIGKSPCPRGTRGASCREDLAAAAQTCTSGLCLQCRRECSSISPAMWPTCCREHFLCCRQLVYACQRCNFNELISFCTTAFKKCF